MIVVSDTSPILNLSVAQNRNDVASLREQLDPGEGEAIVVAAGVAAGLLLFGEKRGRRLAIDPALEVTGLLGHFGGADHRTSLSATFRERWQTT